MPTSCTVIATSTPHLENLVRNAIESLGNDCSLNHIDVSGIVDFSALFMGAPCNAFNGDISQWDTSNAISMARMFACSTFDGDISQWNTSNVVHMREMFKDNSAFNGDISNWDVSSAVDMSYMFCSSVFNGDLSRWCVANVRKMGHMFANGQFNGDIGNWDVGRVTDFNHMFSHCKFFDGDLSRWNTSNATINHHARHVRRFKIQRRPIAMEHIVREKSVPYVCALRTVQRGRFHVGCIERC